MRSHGRRQRRLARDGIRLEKLTGGNQADRIGKGSGEIRAEAVQCRIGRERPAAWRLVVNGGGSDPAGYDAGEIAHQKPLLESGLTGQCVESKGS
jgi:hypothetical protein